MKRYEHGTMDLLCLVEGSSEEYPISTPTSTCTFERVTSYVILLTSCHKIIYFLYEKCGKLSPINDKKNNNKPLTTLATASGRYFISHL